MADEPLAPDVRALWQHQVTEGGSMSATEVRRRAEELQEKARRRVAAIYMSGAGNAGIPLVLMWFLPELRLGLGYLVVTALVLVAYVRRRSVFRTVSPNITAAQGLVFYRHLLERERDFRSGQRALVHHWSRVEYHRAHPCLHQQSAFPPHGRGDRRDGFGPRDARDRSDLGGSKDGGRGPSISNGAGCGGRLGRVRMWNSDTRARNKI